MLKFSSFLSCTFISLDVTFSISLLSQCSGEVSAQKALGYGLENITVWLKLPVSFTTITDEIIQLPIKSFGHSIKSWNCPQVSLQISSPLCT